MLSGNNGVLQRATDAKTKSDEAQIKERIQLAYHSALTGGKGSYTKETLEEELEKEFGENNYNVDDSDSNNWILTGKVQEKEQNVTIPAGEIVDTTWQQAFIFPEYGNLTRFTLDESNKTLTLKGGPPLKAENIEIKNYAVINGVKYMTKFPDSCSSLFVASSAKTIKIDSKIDTSNVNNMSGMFLQCTNLTELEISDFNTNNVTNMSQLFQSCKLLSTLNLSKWNTSKVTDMNQTFCNCQLLKDLDVSTWNTSKVENMYSMFANCDSLESIDLSSFNTNSVTNMSQMFVGSAEPTTSLLKEIIVSTDFSTNSVENSQNMFKRCINLVGGNGTTFNSSKIDATMAHIDGGTSNPGYFTAK